MFSLHSHFLPMIIFSLCPNGSHIKALAWIASLNYMSQVVTILLKQVSYA